MDMPAPPSYALSAAPPSYSVSAGHSHSVLSGGSSQTSIQEYIYTSGPLSLNLGPKRFGLERPAYGWNDLVEGFVRVKKNTKGIQSIVVHVEGEVTSGVFERGFMVDQCRKTVMRLSQTIFESTTEQPSIPREGIEHHFSFPLPSYVTGGTEPLPSTSSLWYAGIAANVTYFVWVEMTRKARFRPNERLKACFHYLPRTYAPLRVSQVPLYETTTSVADEKSYLNEPQEMWEEIGIEPSGGQENLASPFPSVHVRFALPRPATYASSQDIPFKLSIQATCTAQVFSLLLSSLSVKLCRIMTIASRGQWTKKETVLAGGEVHKIVERRQERIMYGTITCSQVSGESSWQLGDLKVKHLIRICLAPPRDLPGLAAVLPIYAQSVPIIMRTHQETAEGIPDDAHMPALCRLPRRC